MTEGLTVIDAAEAVHRLVAEWAENGGEVDDQMVESFGPWG